MSILERCLRHHQSKIRLLWSDRFDEEDRYSIRFSLRKLREIRDNGNTLQAF
jgi:hypothetical protein